MERQSALLTDAKPETADFLWERESVRTPERALAGRQLQPASARAHSATLHSTTGNRAARRLLRSSFLQPKLTIGDAADVCEKEADAVAEQVVSAHAVIAASGSGSDGARSDGSDDDGRQRGLSTAKQNFARQMLLRRIPIRTLQQTFGNRGLARLLQEALTAKKTPPVRAAPELGRKCACGGEAETPGECAECRKNRLALQREAIGDSLSLAEAQAESGAKVMLSARQPVVAPHAGAQPKLRRQVSGSAPSSTTSPTEQPPNPAPATPGQTGGDSAGSSTGTCTPQGLDRSTYLATPGATMNDFGLTKLDPTAVTYPTVTTNPAPKGVTVAPTTAALPNIPSVYTKDGEFIEGQEKFFVQGGGRCTSKDYPIRWIINSTGAQSIAAGEQEHCSDLQYAFSISLKQFADAVNALAASQQAFTNQRDAETALTKTTGVAPANWQNVFLCLAKKTELRDTSKWHTPKPDKRKPDEDSCVEFRYRVSSSSLPEVGQHPSTEIIKGCGEKQPAATPTTPGNK